MAISILIIDRERELVESIADCLAHAGFELLKAWQLDQVTVALRQNRPDVIISHSTVPAGELAEVNVMAMLDDYPAALVVISSRPFSVIDNLPGRAVRVPKPFGRSQLIDAVKSAIAFRDLKT
jgi:DNA-binding NtrC family response regulator